MRRTTAGRRIDAAALASELIQYATEIKVRAERRCGELLRQTEKNTGVRVSGGVVVERCDRHDRPTLDDMGLTKSESSRYQQLAAMPADGARGEPVHADAARACSVSSVTRDDGPGLLLPVSFPFTLKHV